MTDSRSRVQTYYERFFPSEAFCELMSRSWRGVDLLHKRELCIETTDSAYIRWQSICDAASLRKLFREKHAEKLHTGAIFSDEPRYKKRIPGITPLLRELVFDIDVNDYDVFGIDANDIEACDRAWPIVAFGFKVVKHILSNHFGFENFLLVYSGRRGAHLSVYDARACELTDEARGAIVSFLQPNERPGKDGRPNFAHLLDYPGFKELYVTHILPFWTNFCLKPELEGGMGILDSVIDQETFMGVFANDYANKTMNLAGLSGLNVWKKLSEFADNSKFPESTWRALKETVLTYLWPRLDANVTKLRNHLNKSVFSVHPKTSRVCVPIKGDSFLFKPSLCPTFTDLVDGQPDSIKSFMKSVSDFEKFIKRLKSSTSESWEAPRLSNDGPVQFSMVSKKRNRDDYEDDSQYFYLDKKRHSADTLRVFVAVASSTNPNLVSLFFYTKVQPECIGTVWPGYSPPSRRSSTFPEKQFLNSITDAQASPGTEIVCDSAYVAVLFHPRVSERAADLRMKRMQTRLEEGVDICTLNAEWGEVGMLAMMKDAVSPVWDTKYIYLS